MGGDRPHGARLGPARRRGGVRARPGRAERAWARVSRAEAAALLAFAMALAGAWALAADRDELPGFERAVFSAVNELPDWLTPLLRAVEQVGSVGGALVVAAVAAILSRDWRLTLAQWRRS
jgi:hypothetical protein